MKKSNKKKEVVTICHTFKTIRVTNHYIDNNGKHTQVEAIINPIK